MDCELSPTLTLASSAIALGVRVNVAVEGAEGVVPAEDADGSALLREVARRLTPGGRARRRRLEAAPASVTICKRLPGLVIEFPWVQKSTMLPLSSLFFPAWEIVQASSFERVKICKT